MPSQDTVISGKELAKPDPQTVELPLERQLDSASLTTLPLGSLRGTTSPRVSGENLKHVQLLAQSDTVLPPIIVHRMTMRVIDGMHRVHAARLRGEREIQARFYDGPEADAFVLAVKVNRAHGLPLSLADRKAAAVRIIASHPQWSDRAIAAVTALSHKTIGAIRHGPNGKFPHLDARIGQNGRVRPVNAAVGRSRAAEVLTNHPDASLRQVAAAAGISPETARDVRTRLLHGGDPLLPGQRQEGRGRDPQSHAPTGRRRRTPQALVGNTLDVAALAWKLRRDPALRSSESIQVLIRLLALHFSDPTQWQQLAADVPSRWAAPVAAAAAECAQTWHAFAIQVGKRAGG
jgi:ParB-like chromosome segregation protein Spo0J